MKANSKEAEDRQKGTAERWKRDKDAQMIRQNIQESEQMITTEGQIVSTSRERTILLSSSTIVEGHCQFAEKSCDFEPRVSNDQTEPSSTMGKREIVPSERENKGTGQGQDGWFYSVTQSDCMWRPYFSGFLHRTEWIRAISINCSFTLLALSRSQISDPCSQQIRSCFDRTIAR